MQIREKLRLGQRLRGWTQLFGGSAVSMLGVPPVIGAILAVGVNPLLSIVALGVAALPAIGGAMWSHKGAIKTWAMDRPNKEISFGRRALGTLANFGTSLLIFPGYIGAASGVLGLIGSITPLSFLTFPATQIGVILSSTLGIGALGALGIGLPLVLGAAGAALCYAGGKIMRATATKAWGLEPTEIRKLEMQKPPGRGTDPSKLILGMLGESAAPAPGAERATRDASERGAPAYDATRGAARESAAAPPPRTPMPARPAPTFTTPSSSRGASAAAGSDVGAPLL